MSLTIHQGHWIDRLKEMPDESVQMCVTSPPYWGLRSYLKPNDPMKAFELGGENTPEEYVAKIVEGFREVKRVLKSDGVLWINLGDSYAAQRGGTASPPETLAGGKGDDEAHRGRNKGYNRSRNARAFGLKHKDLVGIPWMCAFALRANGWYLRCDIIWNKPNPMPESVTDRPTKAHEYIFLMSKSPRYFYNHNAIKEPPSPALIKQIEDGYNGTATKDYLGSNVQDASATKSRIINGHRERIDKQRGHSRRHQGFNDRWDKMSFEEQRMCGSNKRSVWTVTPACFKEAHFATFPAELIKPCILAGSKPGNTVLDPFGGSGTSGQVALELGRNAILIELNSEYLPIIAGRCNVTQGLAL